MNKKLSRQMSFDERLCKWEKEEENQDGEEEDYEQD